MLVPDPYAQVCGLAKIGPTLTDALREVLDDVREGDLIRLGQAPCPRCRAAYPAGQVIDRGRHPGVAAGARDQPLRLDHPLTQRGVLGHEGARQRIDSSRGISSKRETW